MKILSNRRAAAMAVIFTALLFASFAPVPTACAETVTKSFALEIVERVVAGGVKTLRVQAGDEVTLHWTTDEAVEIHLHGYDIKLKLQPAGKHTMIIEAKIAGRFPISAHDFGHKNLAYLEVHPK